MSGTAKNLFYQDNEGDDLFIEVSGSFVTMVANQSHEEGDNVTSSIELIFNKDKAVEMLKEILSNINGVD